MNEEIYRDIVKRAGDLFDGMWTQEGTVGILTAAAMMHVAEEIRELRSTLDSIQHYWRNQ